MSAYLPVENMVLGRGVQNSNMWKIYAIFQTCFATFRIISFIKLLDSQIYLLTLDKLLSLNKKY